MMTRIISITALLGTLFATGCASQRTALHRSGPEETSRRDRVWLPSRAVASAVPREVVHFDFDRAIVRNQDKPALDKVASWLRRDKKSVTILEGHADQIGGSRYNEILAEKRARAVRVYLRDQGADPRRVTVISKGKREPLVKGRGRAALQPNRRVEIVWALTGKE